MRSAQWQGFLTLTLFCVVSVNSLSEIGKCCPMGQLLSETSFECTQIATPMELYPLNSSDHPGLIQYSGLPECEEGDYLTTIEVNSFDSIQSPACIEMMYGEPGKIWRPIPKLVYCRPGEDRYEVDVAPSVSKPQVLEIAQCCPKGRAYVRDTKRCVPLPETYVAGNISESNELLSFLPESINAMDFLLISRRPLICYGALSDYEVDAADLILDDGTLYIPLPDGRDPSKEQNISLSYGSSCLELSGDLSSSKKLVVRACQNIKMCERIPCVRKCCAYESLSFVGTECEQVDDPMTDSKFHQAVQNFAIPSNYGVVLHSPCLTRTYLIPPSEGPWTITSEGYLNMSDSGIYLHDDYCLEIVHNYPNLDEGGLYPFQCYQKQSMEDESISHSSYSFFNPTLQGLNSMFLGLTFLVYVSVPELQSVHGKAFGYHVITLNIGYICLPWVLWLTPSSVLWEGKDDEASVACPRIGYTLFFAFIAAAAAVDVICIEILLTLCGLRGYGRKNRAYKKSLAYAWGSPILLTSLAVLSDATEISYSLKSTFNLSRCWFPNQWNFSGASPYFVDPLVLQIIVNMPFFVLIAICGCRLKRDLKRINALDVFDSKGKQFEADCVIRIDKDERLLKQY